MAPSGPSTPLVLAGSLSFTGRYAHLGRLAAEGLRQMADDFAHGGGVEVAGRTLVPEVVLLDDESTRDGVKRRLDAVGNADVLIGPYGSDLADAAASWAQLNRRVIWNHGASADTVATTGSLISVAAPASRYHAAVLEAVAANTPGATVLVAAGDGRFGRAVAGGAIDAADRLGVTITEVVQPSEVPPAPNVDVLLLAGNFEQDVEVVGRLSRRPRVVAAVAAAIAEFADRLGPRAEGVVAPSQWEETLHADPDVGPSQAQVVRALRSRLAPRLAVGDRLTHVDYPTAQAYATGLLAVHCAALAGQIDDAAIAETARGLHCRTFFGAFGLGDDGSQIDHDIVVTQWQQGVKRVIWPPAHAEADPAM